MKVLVAIGVFVVVLFFANYSITGDVVEGEEGEGFFAKIWNFIKGLFYQEGEERIEASAEVSVDILSGGVEDLE